MTSAKPIEDCRERILTQLRPRSQQLYEFVSHKVGLEQLQSRLWNVGLGAAVKAGTIGPINPRLPEPRHRAAKPAAWSGIFKTSNGSTGFHHAPQFAHASNLQFIGKSVLKLRIFLVT